MHGALVGQMLGMPQNWAFLHRKGWLLHLPHIRPSHPDAHSRARRQSAFGPPRRDGWEKALQGGQLGDPLSQKCLGVAVAPAALPAASPALPYGSGTISWTKASPETRPEMQPQSESARRFHRTQPDAP